MVIEACDAIWKQKWPILIQTLHLRLRHSLWPRQFITASVSFRLKIMMNFISNHLKKLLAIYGKRRKILLKGEGSFIRTLDRFRQLPKGAIVIMLDQDDPFEVYKEIGDWATLATGITADLLQYGTKQQCIDYVKKSFDTFAPGGGFIFMQNKPLLCAHDAKTENVLAVYETANDLKKQ